MSFYKKGYSLPFCIILFVAMVHAYPIFALDLLTAIQMAKEADPSLASVRHEYAAFQTLPKQSLASFLPQVSTSYNRYMIDYLTAPITYFDYNAFNYRVNVQQSIINLPAIQDYEQSKLKVQLGEAKLTDAELGLIRKVTEAYFNLLYYKERLLVLNEERKAYEEQLTMTQRLLKAGEATLTDLRDVEARLSEIHYRIISGEKDFYSAKQNLAKLIGVEPEELSRLREDVEFPDLNPPEVEYWLKLASEKNPSLIYYEKNKEIARLEISKQTYSSFPKVDLVGSYVKSTSVEYLRTEPITYNIIGFQFNMPLFTGGYITAKKDEARERFHKAEKDYEAALSDVKQQVIDNYFGARSASAQIKAAFSALQSSELALVATIKSYQAGLRTIVDVLNARSSLFQAKLNLIKSRYDYIKNLVALKYACGDITKEDLEILNSYLTGDL